MNAKIRTRLRRLEQVHHCDRSSVLSEIGCAALKATSEEDLNRLEAGCDKATDR
jgi:hypothetical protein